MTRRTSRVGGVSAAAVLLCGWCIPAFAAGHGASASGVVSLDVYAQGRTVDLLFAFAAAGGVELRHQRSVDGGESWPVAARLPLAPSALSMPHRGGDPQVVASGPHVLVVWTRPGTSKWGSGPLGTALSADGGATWTIGANPADDGSTEGHGYVDAAADTDGAFHLVWLDSRDGAQGLRATSSKDFGRTWEANRTLDNRTCECCWNRVASPRAGEVWALYRDHDPRDMAVAASQDAGRSWSRRGSAGTFNWKFEGCPHVGGGLAFTGDSAHALVWTGEEDAAGLHVIGSKDGARTWSQPVRVGDSSAHHPDLAADGSVLAAVWDDPAGTTRAVLASTSVDGGRTWRTARRLSSAGADASHPLVVSVAPGRFLVAWTERSGDAAWVLKTKSLGGPLG